MKKASKDYFKIALTTLIIAGLFMPYIYGVLPFDILFDNYMDLETLFALTIPILVTIPLLLLLIFKNLLNASSIKVLNFIFLILYILVLADYGYGFYDSLDGIALKEQIPFIVAMVISLLLIVLSFKWALATSERLETILLAIIGFPILLYFTYGITNDFKDLNYGSYVLSLSYLILFILAVKNIYKNTHIEKQFNPSH